MAGSAVGDQTASFLGDYHDKKILEVLVNSSVFYQLADKRPIAMRNGNVITFHTATKLANGSKLTEGVQPAKTFMTGGTKTATLVQYGQVTAIADVMSKTAIVDLMDQAITRLGESAATTIDVEIQNKLTSDATTTDSTVQGVVEYGNNLSSFYYGIQGGLSSFALCGTGQNILGTGAFSGYVSGLLDTMGLQDYGLTINKIRKVVSMLQDRNVRTFDGNYVMVCHPNTIWQLKKDPEWAAWNQPNNAEKMFNGEVGNIEGVRFIQSTNVQKLIGTTVAGFSGYINVILGAQAFAITELSGDSGIRTYTQPFSAQDSGNVLQQNAYAGWKWTGVVKVLDPKQGIGLYSFDNQ